MIPARCASSSASHTSIPIFSASLSGSAPLCNRSASDSPSGYSITRKSMWVRDIKVDFVDDHYPDSLQGHAATEAVKELIYGPFSTAQSVGNSGGKKWFGQFFYSFTAAFLRARRITRLPPRVPGA